jgi:bifunctional oligoribonuclease and PAP phosphatase NrnA
VKEINKILKDNGGLLDQIIRMIKKSSNIAVIGHINPDGDCIGSQIGLSRALISIGKKVDVINEGVFKNNLKSNYERFFLKDIEKEYDLFIIVDVSNKERIGAFSSKIDYEKTIVIDHHITNHSFGKLNWVSGNFISASEMVFLILYRMKIDLSVKSISQNLLDGVLSDNGFYQHIRVNKTLSLLITYMLIERGADPNISYDFMFRNNNIDDLRMYSKVLGRLQPMNGSGVFWTYLSEKDRQEFGNIDFESGTLFSEMKSLKGFQAGIFFKIYESENRVDVSFRSIDTIDVASVAGELGGGGHKVAAGVSIKGNFEDVKNDVLGRMATMMDRVQ